MTRRGGGVTHGSEHAKQAEAIAQWLQAEFREAALEYQRVDEDYQIQPGGGISTWELEEHKDRYLFRIQGEVRHELEVTVMALEDYTANQLVAALGTEDVINKLRDNPARRFMLDRTLRLTAV